MPAVRKCQKSGRGQVAGLVPPGQQAQFGQREQEAQQHLGQPVQQLAYCLQKNSLLHQLEQSQQRGLQALSRIHSSAAEYLVVDWRLKGLERPSQQVQVLA